MVLRQEVEARRWQYPNADAALVRLCGLWHPGRAAPQALEDEPMGSGSASWWTAMSAPGRRDDDVAVNGDIPYQLR